MWDSLSCLLTLLESFHENNPEMGTDGVAKRMHQKTVQYYWVNIVKQQITGGGCPTLRDTSIQPMEAALNQPTFQAQALLGKAISEHTTQQNAEVKSIINKDRQVAPKRMPLGACLAVNTHGGVFCRIYEECTVVDEPARGGRWTRKHSFRFRSKNTTSESMRTNGKDGKIGLMKSWQQN